MEGFLPFQCRNENYRMGEEFELVSTILLDYNEANIIFAISSVTCFCSNSSSMFPNVYLEFFQFQSGTDMSIYFLFLLGKNEHF